MDEYKKLECTVLKYVRVPNPRYEAMVTILTLGFLDKELHEASISKFPSCNCKHLKYMSTREQEAHVDAFQAFVLSSLGALFLY